MRKDCSDYWCENYGKSGGQWDKCVKNTEDQDNAELRVILQRRAYGNIGSSGNNKDRGQER